MGNIRNSEYNNVLCYNEEYYSMFPCAFATSKHILYCFEVHSKDNGGQDND